MANGFPDGNFRIVNKATGACISSLSNGQAHGLQSATGRWGERGFLSFSQRKNRQFTVHDNVKNVEEELWYLNSYKDTYGDRVNTLFNFVRDIRSRWVLSASTQSSRVFLQQSDQQYITKWAFEDGYIFVEGQPDAVLTLTSSISLTPSLGNFEVKICQRSDDPNQRWELK